MLDWPAILKPSAGSYAPFARALSGGQALNGFEQVQPQLDDRWTAQFTFPMGRQDRIRTMRWLLTSLRGRTGTVGLPVFDMARARLGVRTAGSPIGTTAVNPVFATAVYQAATPVPATVSSPTWSQRFPELAGTDFEYGAETITGTLATTSTDGVLRLTPTGTHPLIGWFVTISGKRHLIEDVEPDGSDLLITVSPSAGVLGYTAGGYVYTTVSGITGTATFVSANAVDFAYTGTVPTVGQYITLLSVRRLITSVEANGGGHKLLGFSPGVTVADPSYATVTAHLDSAADLNDTTIDVALTAGANAPSLGAYLSIASRLHAIDAVSSLGSDVYRLTIWPWLRADAADNATVNFDTPLCEMRLASDTEGADALSSLDGMKFGSVSLRFVEAAVA